MTDGITSDIDTPNVDALAAGGLQFTNFHVTPLCSTTPTRRDHGSPTSPRYQGHSPFIGTLHEVEINLGGRSSAETAATARTEMSRR